MLKIGFTNKFYTLWSVSEEEIYSTTSHGHHFLSGIKTNKVYMKNLSFDLKTALEKAKESGCKDLTVDDSLRGVTRSFSTTKSFEYQYKEYEFRFGKYEFQDIRECTDFNYLKWYAKETECKVATQIVLDNCDDMILFNDELMSKSESINKQIWSDVREGKIELVAVSNFKANDYDYDASIKCRIANPKNEAEEQWSGKWGMNIDSIDSKGLNLKRRYYNGYSFFVPAGMRSVKGKKFTIKEEEYFYKLSFS